MSRPPYWMRRLWRSSSRVLPRARLGRISFFLMESGTPQNGMEDHLLHLVGEDRRLRIGLADDHALGVDDLAVLDDAQA